MDYQKKMDKAAKVIRKLIDEANEAADHYCREGDAEASAKLRAVAANLTMAHSVGRTIKTQGGVQPQFGGDGK
jgi:hypothetical protein